MMQVLACYQIIPTPSKIKGPHMKRSFKKKLLWIIVPLLTLIVVGGAGVSWMLSGSSAAPLALKAAGSSTSVGSAGDLSGQWEVVPGPANEATTAGYRVEEKV